MINSINRRQVLQSLGLGGAATFLPTLRRASAATKIPTRFVIFYTQHGTLPWLWTPKGTRDNFELGYLHEPLAAFKKDLILLGGVDSKGIDQGPNDANCGHARGQAGSLTAQTQIKGKLGNGISIDAHVATGLAAQNGGKSPTALPLVHAGILDKSPNLSLWGTPYHQGPGKVVSPEYNPQVIFSRLFPTGKAPDRMMDTSAFDQRKSALDFIKDEFNIVGNKMGKAERERLVQHATLVNELKLRIDATGGGGASCSAPTGIKANAGNAGWWANTSDAMPKLMQAAFACDLTRVFCFQVEEPAPSAFGYTPGAAGTTDLHDLVHKLDVNKKEDQDKARLDIAKRYYRLHSDLFAKVLNLLTELKEADGKPMLYHTAVLWCGEIAQPGHSYHNNKWLLAGNLGGYLKPGQFLSYDNDNVRWGPSDSPNVPSNGDLFTTIANGMGVPTTKFGHPAACRGELADIKA
ncbi:MAG: DUF1552 domain-containing protein [Deltaproteobacteria bacterium]|nr:DUF1552 domain-containing protein [Deltaproteobacteria bacterium]